MHNLFDIKYRSSMLKRLSLHRKNGTPTNVGKDKRQNDKRQKGQTSEATNVRKDKRQKRQTSETTNVRRDKRQKDKRRKNVGKKRQKNVRVR